MDIEDMDLAEPARTAAKKLKKLHPAVTFTSGRRSIGDQARAMSQNVAANRKWIEQTYRATTRSAALQAWVDAHPAARSAAAIEAGLLSVMKTWTADQAAVLSKHIDGLAFDVKPVAGADAAAIKASIRALPGLKKFLETEGGLVRWHAQF